MDTRVNIEISAKLYEYLLALAEMQNLDFDIFIKRSLMEVIANHAVTPNN